MIPIYYKSSEGVVVNLIETPYRMLTETDLLNSEWEPTTVGENFPRITRLDKKQVSPKFKIRVTGSTKTEMANNLEHLESVFDRDCFLNQMGRLYIGEFYRECFITGITHGKVFEKTHTVAEYVATSNNGYWVSNKEISFSGSGALVGEIADKMYVSASHRSQDIIYTPDTDHTAHLEFPDYYVSDGRLWLRFDLGNVTNIGEFSGITVSRHTATPVIFDLQISSGETVDDSRSINVSTGAESTQIKVDDFTEITIDGYGESGWDDTELRIYCYSGDVRETIYAIAGDTIDVSAYDKISFLVNYIVIAQPTTVEYTVNEQQWETIEQYDLNIGEEVEVVATDIECSSIRFKGSRFGIIDSDVSVMSDEEAQMRNLFSLGYQLDNLNVSINNGTYTFGIQDTTRDGYIYFDDTALVIKSIGCYGYVSDVKLQVQALIDDEWENVTEISGTVWTGNVNANKVRVRAYTNGQSEGEYDAPFIRVTTDAKVYNESYAPSNAIIEISGMPNNPSVVIGGYEYGANIELSQGHKLVIDTKKKTVRDYADEDTYENVYASRMGDFTQIETGENEVTWGGNANIKITLEQARSIPKWN